MYEYKKTINHFTKKLLFDLTPKLRKKIAEIVLAITLSGSLRISRISANSRKKDKISRWGRYEFVRGLLEELDVEVIERLMVRVFDADAEYVIGDITEVEMRSVRKDHEYAGVLSDGKTRGIYVLYFATAYKGRAIVFAVFPTSTKILSKSYESKWVWYFKVFGKIKELIGGRLVVYDRELSCLEVFERLDRMGIRYLIRVKVGNVRIEDETGRDLSKETLNVEGGEVRVWRGVLYKGMYRVNLVVWKEKGHLQPIVLATNTEPREDMVEIYRDRMKVEQSFRNMKRDLGMESMMVRDFGKVVKLLFLMVVALNVGLIAGEIVRERLSGEVRVKYSGPFVFFYLLGRAGMLGLVEEDLRVAWVSYEHEVFRILFRKKYQTLDQTSV